MGAVLNLFDRLTNVMSGMGTTIDKGTASFYTFVPMTGEEAEAGYRNSWLNRKIVDVPPFDMTREWRDWQAEDDNIEKLEAEERRLQLKAKCQRALVLARLYGGGALILGTPDGDADPMQPLDPERIRLGELTYVHVMSRHQLTEGQERKYPTDPWFGQPEYFQINTVDGRQIRLHPSRVVAFIGQKTPEGSLYSGVDSSWFWGDPIMQSIGEAVRNADLAQSGFASLINEASIDIVRIPDLMSTWSTSENEKQLGKRVTAAKLGKSNWRTLYLDKDEEWQTRQINWAGIPEIISTYLNVVAGAADIPVTRLLGQSPKGLQSTGEGEERDYHSMVAARQNELLAPALDRIDDLLIRSALGSRPDDIYYEFAPLAHVPPKEAAEIEEIFAKTAKLYADAALIPDVALTAMSKNGIVERGQFPGSEAAFEEAEKTLAEEPPEDDGEDLEPVTEAEQRKKKLTDYNPDQPRDPGGEGGGQWVEAGGGSDDGRYTAEQGARGKIGEEDEEAKAKAEEISKHFKGRALTEAEAEVVGDYTVTQYKHVNTALRSGKSPPAFAKKLDAIIASERVEMPLSVYRGVFASATEAENLPIGSIISDKGFSSTSADPSVGAKFASWAEDSGEQPILLRVAVPEGATALHVNPMRGYNASEHEVLLPRNSRMRVLSEPKAERVTTYPGRKFSSEVPVTVVDVELLS